MIESKPAIGQLLQMRLFDLNLLDPSSFEFNWAELLSPGWTWSRWRPFFSTLHWDNTPLAGIYFIRTIIRSLHCNFNCWCIFIQKISCKNATLACCQNKCIYMTVKPHYFNDKDFLKLFHNTFLRVFIRNPLSLK